MAFDGYVQVPPDSSGDKIDTTELVTTAGTVQRQRVTIPDTVAVDGEVLRRILAEQRTQNILIAQAFNLNDDIDKISSDAVGGLAAGLNTQIQFNSYGEFGADSDFTWTADSGLANLLHTALGSNASIDIKTAAPGDPLHESDSTQKTILNICEFVTGDLASGFFATVTETVGYRHTGTGTPTVYGSDIETYITSNSTGPFLEFDGQNIIADSFGSGLITNHTGLQFLARNFGTANITTLRGVLGYPQQRGSGTVSEMVGVEVLPTIVAGTITDLECFKAGYLLTAGTVSGNMISFYAQAPSVGSITFGGTAYGFYCADYSAVGYNIISLGANSLSRFDGIVITTSHTVATLPSAGNKGARSFVSDATATLTAGIGAIVAGTGANNVPVVADGTNWRIG